MLGAGDAFARNPTAGPTVSKVSRRGDPDIPRVAGEGGIETKPDPGLTLDDQTQAGESDDFPLSGPKVRKCSLSSSFYLRRLFLFIFILRLPQFMRYS